ncbi:MAG: ABC transporter permease [Eubacterium sp.]|nr:ABC transporter permease [Eubacterium sp.]
MAFTYKNNTKMIVKKLAKRSLSADKNRNRLMIITIALATCLIMVTSLYFFYNQRKTLKSAVGRYQAVFQDIDKKKAEQLKSDSRLDVGVSYLLGMINMTDYQVTVRTMDEGLLRLGKCNDIKGQLPKKVDEVMVSSAFLERTDSDLKIGDTIELDFGKGKQQFVLSGILPVDDSSCSIYISEAYVEENVEAPLYSVYINVPETEGWSKPAIQDKITEIAKEYQLEEKQINFSMFYFSLIQQRSSEYMLIISAVAIVVAGACVLVVYSLFYVSIIRKTNEYGRLKTIGTSSKQINKIIMKEGNYLAIYGIPVGIILGELIGYIIVPDGFNPSVAIIVALIVAAYMYICVMLTAIRPAKMASKLTPIEAVRYIAYSGKEKKRVEKKHRPITEKKLAFLYFLRNKKKMILTVSSLGICGILLVGSAAYFDSISPVNMARQLFPYGELKIELGDYGPQAYKSDDYIKLQRSNCLSEEIIRNIQSVEGVKGVLECKGTVLDVNIPTGDIEPTVFNAYTEQEQKLVNEYLLEGTVDVHELTANNGIIISDGLWESAFGLKVAVGDMVSVNTPDGNEQSFKVMGIVDSNMPYSGYGGIFMPENTLSEISGLENLNYQVAISIDESYLESAEQEIRGLFSINDSIYVSHLSDWVDSFKEKLSGYRVPVFVLIAIIGMFGFINLLNTLVTNMIVRKREFGILQAVGLSDIQFSKVLINSGSILDNSI